MKTEQMIRIVNDSFPDIDIKEIQTKSNGWDNNILILNKEMVFRFPKSHEIATKVLAEADLIEQLRQKQPLLQIPQYEFLYVNETFMGVKYDYMHGESLSEPERNFTMDSNNAALLGDFLTKLHSIDLSTLKEKNIITVHTREYWQDLFKSVKTSIFPHLNSIQINEVLVCFEYFFNPSMFSANYETMIHGDLTTANIIFQQERGLISGIIDFTDTQLGDPAFDFAGVYWSFGPEFTKEVLSHYELGDRESIFNRVQLFYGLQPIFHELLHEMKENRDVNWDTALERFSYLLSLRD
ncbi:aminoglycoside phosphotransferase family protein [Bacillus sp. BHET2]|uniref:aminoglycoside phosphotransferase family protein n=1 Tax=Bacillus sp. BHET2 TaxID=2583818 RepID=UPI00110D8D2C|nr:aminoglycoside phosphotransferase family protein [Bacillus sp. BHET2]TMU87268.1 aminoglycoside phosphotransferase family protein [Bacillus sp. BHET2]